MVRAALPSKIRQSIIGRNFESLNDFFEVILLHDHELNAIQADDRNRGKFISPSAAKNYPPSRLPISVSKGSATPSTSKESLLPSIFPGGTKPTDIREPLTSEEKDRRKKEGLCLYCGKKGHTIAQ